MTVAIAEMVQNLKRNNFSTNLEARERRKCHEFAIVNIRELELKGLQIVDFPLPTRSQNTRAVAHIEVLEMKQAAQGFTKSGGRNPRTAAHIELLQHAEVTERNGGFIANRAASQSKGGQPLRALGVTAELRRKIRFS